MSETSDLIERAQEVLMRENAYDASAAAKALQNRARANGLSLEDVAAEILRINADHEDAPGA